MSLSFMKFDDFFVNLPVPAIDLVCKHLETLQLIPCSLLSENWKNAVGKVQNPHETVLDIYFEPKCFQATVTCKNLPFESFIVKYIEDPKVEFKTLLSSVSSSEQMGEHNYSYPWSLPHLFTFAAPKFEVMEKDSLDMLHLIHEVFRPVRNEVVLKLDQNSSEFTGRILWSLPSGKGYSLELRSATGDVCFVKGAALKKVLESVEFTCQLLLHASLDSVFNSEQINLKVSSSLKMDDARFLTQANLKNMRFKKGIFGTNKLTSEDFNLFFQLWKNETVGGFRKTFMTEARFLVSDNQEIDVAKVVHNLNAAPWDQAVRDKGKMIFPEQNWINLENGFDFENVKGMLGTVCIVEKQLLFLTWDDRFPMKSSQNALKRQMSSARWQREQLTAQQKTWTEQMENGEKDEEFLECWRENADKIKECESTIADIQARMEQLERTFSEW